MSFAPKENKSKPVLKKILGKVLPAPEKKPEEKKEALALLRPVNKTSLLFFQRFRLAWRWCMASLPFDFCLLILLPFYQAPLLGSGSTALGILVCSALLMIGACWFVRNPIISLFEDLEGTRKKIFSFVERYPLFIFVIVAAIVALEAFLKLGQNTLWSTILVAIIAVGTVRSMKRTWAEQVKKQKALSKDLAAQIESYNLRVFLIHLVPLLSARLCVLVSATVFVLSRTLTPELLVSLSAGCVLLSLMHPEEHFFMIACRRCGTKTSRFLGKGGVCLQCQPTPS